MDAPERIWLLPHDGEQRCWCDDPAPGLDMDPGEADEYVRADALAAKDAEIERLREALRNVIGCDHHNFYDGPPPRYVQIARTALEG